MLIVTQQLKMIPRDGIAIEKGTYLHDCQFYKSCEQSELTFFGTKYDGGVIDHPAMVDVHCIISIKCTEYLP